jgi:hypothetical protein
MNRSSSNPCPRNLVLGGILLSPVVHPAGSNEMPSSTTSYRAKGWNARPWLDGMQRQDITHITIHHTADRHNSGPRSLEAKLLALQSFSQEVTTTLVGWTTPSRSGATCPYHYFIDVHGQIAEARPIGYCGDYEHAIRSLRPRAGRPRGQLRRGNADSRAGGVAHAHDP